MFFLKFGIDSTLAFSNEFTVASVKFYSVDFLSFAELTIDNENEEEAISIAKDKVSKIVSSLAHIFSHQFYTKIIEVTSCSKNGLNTGYTELSCEIKVVNQITIDNVETIEKTYNLAQDDINVQNVLLLRNLQNYDTYFTLYKIVEIINSDGIGEKIIRRDFTNEYKLFGQTANAPRATNIEDSRHAGKKFMPPENPMGIVDAEKFVHNLTIKWFLEKSNSYI